MARFGAMVKVIDRKAAMGAMLLLGVLRWTLSQNARSAGLVFGVEVSCLASCKHIDDKQPFSSSDSIGVQCLKLCLC